MHQLTSSKGAMATSPGWRAIMLANALVIVGILTFSTGFFPYKPLIPGLATFEETDSDITPIFDKVIFMVVDALRSDFVYSYESGFLFTQSLIRDGAGLPFTAHASSPTVTMPRLKAMTTGSVPSFLDVILNIAESDTTSSLTYQDTWLAQLKAQGGRLAMYGDDTWLKLFPGMFDRADGTTSFFVSDFVEVDQNVTRHVPDELAKSDWSALIMHYLGLDHIGHKAGPQSSYMLPKQQEMDAIVKTIYTAMQEESHLQSTLLVLCGDHGMNDAGNHGGSSAGETSPALMFISPKLKVLDQKLDSPTVPFGDFQYYKTVQQADITSTLAGLLGLPIPLNSLGVFIPEFLNLWDSGPRKLSILYRNARQLLFAVKTTFPGVLFDKEAMSSCSTSSTSGIEDAICAWSEIHGILRENSTEDTFSAVAPSLERFSRIAQDVMSSAATNYDTSRLGLGLLITGIAALVVMPIVYRKGAMSPYSSGFLTFFVLAYGGIMFASSYVEEEQQFWYWICSGWMFYLHIKSASLKDWTRPTARLQGVNWAMVSVFGLLCCQRVLRRWNQTGQKFTGEPDIARSFLPENPHILWTLVILTYIDAGRGLLVNLSSSRLPRVGALMLLVLSFSFKLNFVANDSPELLTNSSLSLALGAWPNAFSLVPQARVVFGGVACYMSLAATAQHGRLESQGSKALFHEALNIFLITQSRVTNIPIFLVFRIQALILNGMNLNGIEVTMTTLIMQYLTFFAFGGSNSISSVDLSSAYNGVGSYSVVMVGILTFVSNWAGPIWWVSASQLLQPRDVENDRSAAFLTFHTASSLVFVMAACTALRTHLFIWTVFSPKYLYSMVWAIASHVGINLLGGIGLPILRKQVIDISS